MWCWGNNVKNVLSTENLTKYVGCGRVLNISTDTLQTVVMYSDIDIDRGDRWEAFSPW
jgi:hypothetical protein